MTPSILQGVTLFVVMYGTSLLRNKYLRKILPLLLLYSTFFLIAQGIYNLDFEFPTSEVLENIGFIKYDPYIIYMGIQCIPISLLAAYWRYSVYFKKKMKEKKRKAISSHMSQASGGESSDNEDNQLFGTEKEIRHPHSKKRDLQDKGNGSNSNKETSKYIQWIEKIAENTKYSAVLSWRIFLKNSYYFTLLALLLCSLIDANLFNFGYLCFFVVFLLSRKIAMMFWIVLVIYTESVIMVIFLWQLHWTEKYDDTNTAEWFGLQHYEYLITGLMIPLLIFIFSLVQLGLIRVFKRRLKKEGRTLRDKNVSTSEFDHKLDAGPKTRIILNSIEYFLDFSLLWICYLTLYVVSMIGQYDLFSL